MLINDKKVNYIFEINTSETGYRQPRAAPIAAIVAAYCSFQARKIVFKGLVKNMAIKSLTTHQIRNAFRKSTDFKLSNHTLERFQESRTKNMGVKTLDDFSKIINQGNMLDAGDRAIGYHYKGMEVIFNPATNVIMTVRPRK